MALSEDGSRGRSPSTGEGDARAPDNRGSPADGRLTVSGAAPASSTPPSPRVCVLLESYYPVVGGMESQARELAGVLKERGVGLLFVTRRTSPDLKPAEEVDGIPVYRAGPTGRSSRNRWALAVTSFPLLVRRRRDYDIILVPGLRALGATAAVAARLLGKRAILKAESCGEVSGSFFAGGLAKLRLRLSAWPVRAGVWCRNRIMAGADAFVTMSTEMTAEFTAGGMPAGRIRMIPQTFDADRFRPVTAAQKAELRRRLNLPADRTLAIFTGRLVSYKGVPALLRVWEVISRERPGLTLLVVGAGGTDMYNCEQELKDFAAAHDMGERVVFTGAVRNVQEYLQASDLFAFPTENEAFGISLIEAMGCGLPVVSTRVGGIPDIITPERDGLLIDAGQEGQLREALLRLLGDAALRERLGQGAVASVQARYTRPIVGRQYQELFRDVMEGRYGAGRPD